MKKKHLSKIVFQRLVVLFISSFAALLAVTIVYFFLYGRDKIGEEIASFLSNYGEENVDKYIYEETVFLTDTVDNALMENGPDYIENPDFLVKTSQMVESGWCSEWNIVDENGIIVKSSVEDYVGFDMHTGEQSTEFLCLLNGEDFYLQDFREISFDQDTRMLYAGAPLHSIKGFLQIGFDEEMYRKTVMETIEESVATAQIGIDGYMLFINDENEVIASTGGRFNGETLVSSKSFGELASSNKVRYEEICGIRSYVVVIPYKDFYVMAGMPLTEVYEPYIITLITLTLIYASVFIVLFLLIRHLISSQVVKGVYSLNGTLSRITKGNLEEKADFRDSIEFDELSNDINSTVDRLKQLIREAEQRIDEELALAAKIQTSFIPHKFPAFPDRTDFDLFAKMVPAKEVGGDFYDFFLIDEDHLALVMADVSGKGIPAALFMVLAKDKLEHSTLKFGTDVASAIKEVNLELLKENDEGFFVTVWLGVVTLSTGHVDYVNAGHEYPAICRAGGSFTSDEDIHCAPVAARKKAKFEAGAFELGFGDLLYLYTDGVTEANDPDGEMFRRSRMLEALNSDTSAPIEEIDANVRRAIDVFVQEAPQFDDTTTLIFQYKKNK